MKPKLIMLIGLSGSGKSTFAKKYKEDYKDMNFIIHSSDELRKELYNDINNQDNNNELFKILHSRIKQDLSNGNSVIYDATNLSYKKRKSFLDTIKTDCEKIAIVIYKDYEECIKDDKFRERTVGKNVIFKQLKSFYMPNYYEGFDEIEIEYMSIFNDDSSDMFDRLIKIPQDNPHHKLTIGNHCLKCGKLLNGTVEDFTLIEAGYLHDIGKESTKSFTNYKGETTNVAHYYNHQNVSSYLAIDMTFCLDYDDIIDVCNLIQFHMLPFSFTEKSKKKYTKLFGEDFMIRLMLLHEADIKAKE